MNYITKISPFLKVLMVLIIIGKFWWMFQTGDYSRLEVCIVSIPLIMAADILRYFKVKVGETDEFLYLAFLFISLILGSIFRFYEITTWFDKFAHLFSGIVTALLGLIIIKRWKVKSEHQRWFEFIFINGLSLAIAGLWEIYEFIAGWAISADLQRVASTGVSDTMWDMIIAMVGSLLTSAAYFWLSRKHTLKQIISHLIH